MAGGSVKCRMCGAKLQFAVHGCCQPYIANCLDKYIASLEAKVSKFDDLAGIVARAFSRRRRMPRRGVDLSQKCQWKLSSLRPVMTVCVNASRAGGSWAWRVGPAFGSVSRDDLWFRLCRTAPAVSSTRREPLFSERHGFTRSMRLVLGWRVRIVP